MNCSKNGFWYMTSLTPFNDNFYLDKYCTQSCSVNFSSKKNKNTKWHTLQILQKGIWRFWESWLVDLTTTWYFFKTAVVLEKWCYTKISVALLSFSECIMNLEDNHRSRECMQSGVCITLWKKVKKSLLFNCFQVKFLNKWLQNLILKSVSNHLGNL